VFDSFVQSVRQGTWLTRERFVVYPRLFFALFLVALVLLVATAHGGFDRDGKPLGTDFLNVYAAGVILHRAQPARVYEPAYQHQVEQEIMGSTQTPYYGWHYPPPFLGMAYLLGTMPYLMALLVYLLGTMALLFLAFRWLGLPFKDFLVPLAAFPAVFINLGHGQNGFLTTALYVIGFVLIGRSSWLSGLCFGLLVYKPQFFLFLPLALFAGRYYRPALWSVFFAFASLIASYLWLGPEVWAAFFQNTAFTKQIVLEQGNTGWEKIQSVFALVRQNGGSIITAYVLQTGAAVVSCVASLLIWRGKSSLETKMAVLCVSSLLATPYILDYDLVLLALPIVLLAGRGSRTGFLPYEKTLLAVTWGWPLLARSFAHTAFQFTPILLAVLLAACWQRAQQEVSKAIDPA